MALVQYGPDSYCYLSNEGKKGIGRSGGRDEGSGTENHKGGGGGGRGVGGGGEGSGEKNKEVGERVGVVVDPASMNTMTPMEAVLYVRKERRRALSAEQVEYIKKFEKMKRKAISQEECTIL